MKKSSSTKNRFSGNKKGTPYAVTPNPRTKTPEKSSVKSTASKSNSKPEWNSLQKDSNEFRLPKEEMTRRKKLFISKHNILAQPIPEDSKTPVKKSSERRKSASFSTNAGSVSKSKLFQRSSSLSKTIKKLDMNNKDSDLNADSHSFSFKAHELDSLTLIQLEHQSADLKRKLNYHVEEQQQTVCSTPVQSTMENSPSTNESKDTCKETKKEKVGTCLEALGQAAELLKGGTGQSLLQVDSVAAKDVMNRATETANALDGSSLLPACALAPLVKMMQTLAERQMSTEESFRKALKREMTLVTEVKELKLVVDGMQNIIHRQQDLLAKIEKSLDSPKKVQLAPNKDNSSREQKYSTNQKAAESLFQSPERNGKSFFQSPERNEMTITSASELETTNDSLAYDNGDTNLEDSDLMDGDATSMEAWSHALERMGALVGIKNVMFNPAAKKEASKMEFNPRSMGMINEERPESSRLNPWEVQGSLSIGSSSSAMDRDIEVHTRTVQEHLAKLSRGLPPPRNSDLNGRLLSEKVISTASPDQLRMCDLYVSSPSTDSEHHRNGGKSFIASNFAATGEGICYNDENVAPNTLNTQMPAPTLKPRHPFHSRVTGPEPVNGNISKRMATTTAEYGEWQSPRISKVL